MRLLPSVSRCSCTKAFRSVSSVSCRECCHSLPSAGVFGRQRQAAAQRFTLCAAALLLAACGARPGTSLEEFRTTIYRPAYAAGFEIVGAEGLQSTILRTRTPWQGAAEGTATALFIARNGETPPAGFDGQTVEAGAQRIVCMSSTHVAMLDAVGAAPRIVGVSGRESIANGYVAAHPDRVGDVGYDGNVNYERLLSLRPDLVLLFGVNGASPMEPKLRELGIPSEEEDVICADDFTVESGCRAMRERLKRPADFTAVFAIADDMAIGAMRALRESGRSIPEDCSIIAIDGINVSEYIHPMLTTLCQPMTAMGTKSVELLLGVIRGGAHDHLTLPTTLRAGESVRDLTK